MNAEMVNAAFMSRALLLAERGRGRTSPNPMVGALVVSPDGVIVGRGFHERAGTPHAEIHALADAGDRARGATLYCTLEPCCHTGRTGPCTLAIERAGISRVVAAMVDPNPAVAGGGLRYLRERGIDVSVGALATEAARLNEVFVTTVTRGRPFVTLKIAMSLDGRIAGGPGQRTALTSAAANRHAQRLRAEVDAIAVGANTVLVDDPLLTARDVYRWRPLVRVLFDRRLRTPPTARVLTTLDAGPVIIVTSEQDEEGGAGAAEAAATVDTGVPAARRVDAAGGSRNGGDHAARRRALADAGATIVTVPVVRSRRAAHAGSAAAALDLHAAFARLLEMGITSVLLEGGALLHAAAWEADLVDRVRIYVTPRALGPAGVPWEMPSSFTMLALRDRRVEWLGDDCLLEGYVHRVD